MKTYLSRRDAAQKYDVSIAKLRRWEEKGRLHRIDADLVDQNRRDSGTAVQWVYDEEEVRALAEALPSKHIVTRNQDAKVFELFDAGKNLVEVVRHTKLPVKDVQPLREIHVQETGGVFVPGPVVAQIVAVGLPRERPADWPAIFRRLRKHSRVNAARLHLAEQALRALGHEPPKLSSSLQKAFDDDESSSE